TLILRATPALIITGAVASSDSPVSAKRQRGASHDLQHILAYASGYVCRTMIKAGPSAHDPNDKHRQFSRLFGW
ncbi:MAG: hypothetical protein ACE1ZA_07130, partial [Pseudomonadales bacterium]